MNRWEAMNIAGTVGFAGALLSSALDPGGPRDGCMVACAVMFAAGLLYTGTRPRPPFPPGAPVERRE